MLPSEASLLHALELLRQASSLGEPVIFLTGADEPDLIPLELLSIAGGLVDEDLALGLADTALELLGMTRLPFRTNTSLLTKVNNHIDVLLLNLKEIATSLRAAQ